MIYAYHLNPCMFSDISMCLYVCIYIYIDSFPFVVEQELSEILVGFGIVSQCDHIPFDVKQESFSMCEYLLKIGLSNFFHIWSPLSEYGFLLSFSLATVQNITYTRNCVFIRIEMCVLVKCDLKFSNTLII